MPALPLARDPFVPPRLGQRLKARREAEGWSIAELAARSRVSKAMISRIERGEASPTAELLARLATGFGVTLASLFVDDRAPSAVARRADQPAWRDPASGYVRRNVSPPGVSPVEIVDVTFPPGQRVLFDNLRDIGVDQQVWVLDGELEMTLGEEAHRLGPGDCLHMRLDRPVTFHNPSDRPVRYAVVIARLPGGAS
jgi:transcriptional regulator with XRE-family HTH domain